MSSRTIDPRHEATQARRAAPRVRADASSARSARGAGASSAWSRHALIGGFPHTPHDEYGRRPAPDCDEGRFAPEGAGSEAPSAPVVRKLTLLRTSGAEGASDPAP